MTIIHELLPDLKARTPTQNTLATVIIKNKKIKRKHDF